MNSDVLVIGSGISGITFSIKLALINPKIQVILISKSNFRKERDAEEQKNLKIKMQIIEDIDNLTKEEESIKKTFEQFRILQDKWKNTGYVPASHNNNLWQSYHHHVELFYDFIK